MRRAERPALAQEPETTAPASRGQHVERPAQAHGREVVPARTRQTNAFAAPKERESRTPGLFPRKLAASWEPRRGPRCRSRTLLAGTPPRLVPPWWWAKVMPPLWQYLAPFVIARRAHGCPQRARIVGSLGRSFLQIALFLGSARGPRASFMTPSFDPRVETP